jgi:hypothetical protein
VASECRHVNVSEVRDETTGVVVDYKCDDCGTLASEERGPEDEPDSDDEGEGEDDEPSGIKAGDAASVGERIRETAERESLPDDEPEAESVTAAPSMPPHDPYTETCPTCDGFGETFTGSRVDEYFTRTCVTCRGMGFVDATPPQPPYPIPRAESEPDTEPSSGPWTWPQAHVPPNAVAS